MIRMRNAEAGLAKARSRILKLKTEVAYLKQQNHQKDQVIANLQDQLAIKEQQRKELAAKIFKPKNQNNSNSNNSNNSLKAPTTRTSGAQIGHTAHHRPAPSPEDVTDRRTFDLAVCPCCRGPVGEAVDKVEKYQEDIDFTPRKVVRHYTITRHWCPKCQEYVRPWDTPAQNLRRFGPNITGYILYARYRLRLPLNKIVESLADLHNFHISEGEVTKLIDEAAIAFGKEYELVTELIRTAKAVHADETGWRMNGNNWFMWAFTSKADDAILYEIAETRGGGIPKRILGDNKDRVIISDGYAVYAKIPGEHQQCWVHLLRPAKKKHPGIYQDLCCLYDELLNELPKPIQERNYDYFSKTLTAIADNPYTANKRQKPDPLLVEVQNRIKKHHDDLLTCLKHDGVLPENNTAERAIRPQVVIRKISGGSRSPNGAKSLAVNTSVIATKLAGNKDKNKSFFDVMIPVIREAWPDGFAQGGE
jgi:transposase